MKQFKFEYILMILIMTFLSVKAKGQETDSLEHYLEVAARNNPGLNADFLTYKASLEKVSQAGAWPDPQLDMGIFLKPMNIVGGQQIADFTLMQMFPWFGTKKTAQSEATHMAKMSYEKFRETRDNLYMEVYRQWYLLSALKEQINNNRDNLQLLKQLEELALRKISSSSSGSSSLYSLPTPPPVTQNNRSTSAGNKMAGMGSMGGTAMSGSNSSSMTGMSSSASNMSADMSSSPGMSDVLRIQLEMIEIENNITTLLSDIAAEKAIFNALLNRPVEIEVVIPDSIVKVPFIFDERVSINEIERGNPMLGMFEEEELAYRAKNEMDKKMSYPMLGLGLQYMLIGENKTASIDSGMKPEMSGMDMIMPMFSISIPIYRNKYKAQQRENRFMWESARENYNNTLNMLQSELFKLKHELDNADRKITLYQKQAQLARVAYQLVVQEFVTAKSDLTNVIQVQRQLLDYQLRNAEAIAEYNIKVASIRKLGSFNTSNN